MIVMLAGASGLVGQHTLEDLLRDSGVERVIVIVRKKLSIDHAKLIQIETSFDKLKDLPVQKVDAALCALGSTIKKAGSQKEFKKVDHDFVVNFAEYAKKCGAEKFSVISSLGANSHSRVFYNRVKGETEESLLKLSFSTLTIIRPSLLIGERKEKRVAEKLFIELSPLLNLTMIGPLKKYRGVEAKKVATHLARSVKTQERGLVIIENDQLLNI